MYRDVGDRWWCAAVKIGDRRYLVESNHKGSLAHLEEVDGLDGLLLQTVHHVHHQNGDVTQAGAS